jgi:hypothetical protein
VAVGAPIHAALSKTIFVYARNFMIRTFTRKNQARILAIRPVAENENLSLYSKA